MTLFLHFLTQINKFQTNPVSMFKFEHSIGFFFLHPVVWLAVMLHTIIWLTQVLTHMSRTHLSPPPPVVFNPCAVACGWSEVVLTRGWLSPAGFLHPEQQDIRALQPCSQGQSESRSSTASHLHNLPYLTCIHHTHYNCTYSTEKKYKCNTYLFHHFQFK